MLDTFLSTFASIVSSLAWPIVVVCALKKFREPIIRFIDRIKSVNKEGSIILRDPQTSAKEPDAFSKFQEGLDSSLFLDEQSKIEKYLLAQELTDPADARKSLVHMLARTAIFGQFEIVQIQLYKSQLDTLNFLNRQPASKMYLTINYYAPAVVAFPEYYKNRLFDVWFGFLQHSGLVVEDNVGIRITPRGREFLKWRVSNGRPDPLYF